jgi:hypothetical protein
VHHLPGVFSEPLGRNQFGKSRCGNSGWWHGQVRHVGQLVLLSEYSIGRLFLSLKKHYVNFYHLQHEQDQSSERKVSLARLGLRFPQDTLTAMDR